MSVPEERNAVSAPVFDRQHLARYTLGDVALERELLGLFAAQLQSSVAQLKAAISASEWKMASHTLKGSAAAVGAAEINRLAVELEQRGYRGRPDAADPDIAELEAAANRFTETAGRIIG